MNEETINYRLDNIEETLNKLTNLITETQLQQKDIEELKNTAKQQAEEIKDLKNIVLELKQQPVKAAAGRWNYIVDYVFKFLVAAGVGAVLLCK